MLSRLFMVALAVFAGSAARSFATNPPTSLTELPGPVMCAPTVQYWVTEGGDVIHTPTADDCQRASAAGLIRPGTGHGAYRGRAGLDQIGDYQWPQPGHSERKDFWNAVRPRDTLAFLWQQSGAGSAWAPWFGQPVAAESVVVNVDCYNGYLYCRDILDGSLVWGTKVQRAYYYPCSPVIFEGTGGDPWVAVPKYDTGAMLYSMGCYKLSDGTAVWDVPLPIYNPASNINFCVPTYHDGSIYHIVLEYDSAYGGHIVKVDAITGDTATLCRYGASCGGGLTIDPTGQYGFYPRWNPASPGTDSCRILKIDLSTGSAVDSTPAIPDLLRGSAALNPVSMKLFCAGSGMSATSGYLYCFDAGGLSTGHVWRGLTEGGNDLQSASTDDLNAYVCTQSNPSRLYAFDQEDGSVPANWSDSGYITADSGMFDGAVVATGEAGGTRYLYLTPSGHVWVVNADSGATVQFQQASDNVFTGGARPAGFLVAKSGYGKLLCWESPGDLLLIQNDLGVSRWISPVHNLMPDSTYAVSFEVKNYGILNQTDCAVACVIQNTAGDTLYSAATLVSVPAGDSAVVTWDSIVADSELWEGHRMTGYTALPGDERPYNDTATWNAMTTGDTAMSYMAGSAPTLDGQIVSGEWDDAYEFDCSDVFGWGGASQSAGSAYAWFKQDNLNMYLAFAMPNAESRRILDQVGFFCDENYDRSWPAPGTTTEGDYLFWVNYAGNDEVLYTYRTTGGAGQPQPVTGAQCVSGTTNGYLVIETKLPIGTAPYKLTIDPSNDTAGVWLYVADSNDNYGWWPMMTPSENTLDPAYYGTVVFQPTQQGDVGVTSIAAPAGRLPPGSSVQPAATWKNNGPGTAMSFTARCILIDPTGTRVYDESQPVTALPVGTSTTLTFPSHVLGTEGVWYVKCTTHVAGDTYPLNDYRSQGFAVGLAVDYAVTQLVAPTGTVDTGATVTPQARAKCNYAQAPTDAKVMFFMDDPVGARVYTDSAFWAGALSGAESLFSFTAFNVGGTTGRWVASCSLVQPADTLPTNDWKSGSFYVGGGGAQPGWHELTQLPAGVKPVKQGGWLSFGDGVVYGAKGNKTGEFYSYSATTGQWTPLKSIPNDPARDKPPYKGAAGCADNSGQVYATIGNNTQGFYKYAGEDSGWTALALVPEGPTGKRVKGGTGLAFAARGETSYVYLMKGYKDEFWRYDPLGDSWRQLSSPPTGVSPKYADGSWIVFDGDSLLYVHKAKFHDFYSFNIYTETWIQLPKGMPLTNGQTGKDKKSKAGGSGTWSDANQCIYAFKGGNTPDFYKYVPDSAAWVELETIPRFGTTMKKKAVKDGGSLAAVYDYVCAIKGNKTLEFWAYGEPVASMPAPRLGPDGVLDQVGSAGRPGIAIEPSLLADGRARVHFSLPRAGDGVLRICDVAGRIVLERDLSVSAAGTLDLDLRRLSAGVYLVKLSAGDFTAARKLVIER